MVAWGINPGQAVGVTHRLPRVSDARPEDQDVLRKAYAHTGFAENSPLQGLHVDVAFVGSCTNGRISDLREAARVVKGSKVSPQVKALAVPGSKSVARQAVAEGLADVFRAAGFEWREAGCSMCLAMNPDKLTDRQVCASTSNRNFIGRQGSPKGRTLLDEPRDGGGGRDRRRGGGCPEDEGERVMAGTESMRLKSGGQGNPAARRRHRH